MPENENTRLRSAYQRRWEKGSDRRHSFFHRDVLLRIHQQEKILLKFLARTIGTNLADKRLLDVGCGTGPVLLAMLRYGFQPQNCFGIDPLPEQIEHAKKRFPNITFACCSAENIPFEKNSFHLVTLFTCLSSILDSDIRRTVCRQAFDALRPGGWLIIYDFRVNNPSNPDVQAVTFKELIDYFPHADRISKTLTLAPPLARRIARFSMPLCSALTALPFLRTHRLTAFQKPSLHP